MGNVAEIVLAPAAVRRRMDAIDRFLRANKEADAGRHLAVEGACGIRAKARASFDLGYESSAQQR